MTPLVYEQSGPPGPKTHVLAIGVGSYAHLLDGSKELATDPMGFGQLTSPPLSARAFVDWVLGADLTQSERPGLRNPDAELGSVQLLLSSPQRHYTPPGSSEMLVDSATLENVHAAFDAWLERCNAHPENVAIFFFSGHGVELTDHYLLMEDFGSTDNMWTHSLNFDSLRRGMDIKCEARTQCFFIEACRKPTGDAINTGSENINAAAFLGTNIKKVHLAENQLVLKSTPKNDDSHGLKDEIGVFTKALVAGLEGRAASKTDGNQWVVKMSFLQGLMDDLMMRDAGVHCWATHRGSGLIHHLSKRPRLDVTLRGRPQAAWARADLSMEHHSRDEPKERHRRGPAAGPWRFEAGAGFYTLRMHLSGRRRNPPDETIYVNTPWCEETVKVDS